MDSSKIKQIFDDNIITTVFLSEITKIEFVSTVWKKVRAQQMSVLQANEVTDLFESDSYKYTFILTDSLIQKQAKGLVTKYGEKGLKTLDSIQFATAISLRNYASRFITSDKMLDSFFGLESLPTVK